MILCLVLASAIFSPLLLHAVTMEYIPITYSLIPLSLPKIDLCVAVSISAVIAVVIAFVFYRMALKNAQEFLTKAEI